MSKNKFREVQEQSFVTNEDYSGYLKKNQNSFANNQKDEIKKKKSTLKLNVKFTILFMILIITVIITGISLSIFISEQVKQSSIDQAKSVYAKINM